MWTRGLWDKLGNCQDQLLALSQTQASCGLYEPCQSRDTEPHHHTQLLHSTRLQSIWNGLGIIFPGFEVQIDPGACHFPALGKLGLISTLPHFSTFLTCKMGKV